MSFSFFKWFKGKAKKQELVKTFKVYSGNEFIGYSHLENGNPVVCDVFGMFFPVEAYLKIQKKIQGKMLDSGEVEELKLSVRSFEGELLTPFVSLNIDDRSSERGIPGLQIYLNGLDWEKFEKHFPELDAAYESSLVS